MAFHISRAGNSEINECNFLLSCRPFVQKYLRSLTAFDQMRSKETTCNPTDMLYFLLKLNSMYHNMLDCVQLLTNYSDNVLLADNTKFGASVTNNRKKVLNDLDFIELFCQILNHYYDNKDLEVFSEDIEGMYKRKQTLEGSVMAEDADRQTGSSLKKQLHKYYDRYVGNGIKLFEAIYTLLCSLVQKEESNQNKLYSLLGCFQKHFAYFDKSLDLAMVMIEDNISILTKLSDSFFESLHIVKDILISRDKKVYFQVDLEVRDKNHYIYDEISSKKDKDPDESEDIEEQKEEEKRIEGRPISTLVYLLILLSRKVRHKKILQILALSCTYKGGNFVPNQENFIELFSENKSLVLLFLSDLRMGQVEAVKRLVNRYEEDSQHLVLRALFDQKKIIEIIHERRINFLTEQINFYATLCKGRNLKWKDFLKKLFPEEALINEVVEWHYTNEFVSSLWRLMFILYIDKEPLHDIRIPQMSKLIERIENKIQVSDMISLYSKVMAKEKEIRPMLDMFVDVVDLCQHNIKTLKELYLTTASPDKDKVILAHQSDNLLRDFLILLNRIMGFGVVPFFEKYEYLSQIAKLSLESIQINSANTHIGFILELAKLVDDTSKGGLRAWLRKTKKQLTVKLDNQKSKVKGQPINKNVNENDDIEENKGNLSVK